MNSLGVPVGIRRSFFTILISTVLVGLVPICSFAQYEIPVLSKDQARIILQQIWPQYAMESEWVTGIPKTLPDTVLCPSGRLVITLTDSLIFTLNDTIRDAVFTYDGMLISRTALTTGDINRSLVVRVIFPNAAVVAWLPNQFLWDDSQSDSVYAWVRQAVLTDIPAQYVSSNHDWKALDSILVLLTTNTYQREVKVVPRDEIVMEEGSIFISYNNTTQTLTYLRRKQ